MLYREPLTGLPVADPELYPITKAADSSGGRAINTLAAPMIQSVSGWRKVFSKEGGEESCTAEIDSGSTLQAAAAAAAFIDYLIGEVGRKQELTIIIGTDSRPTGPAVADAAARIFLARGCRLIHLFIVAAPEIMAFSSAGIEADGFFYITASHNPVGHNGIKLGRYGGVLGGKASSKVIDRFRDLCEDPGLPRRLAELEKSVHPERYKSVLEDIPLQKAASADAYRTFTVMTASSTAGVCGQDQVMSRIREYGQTLGLGVVVDFNGSARTTSIDIPLLSELGIRVRAINDRPGEILHQILPEGEALEPCRKLLEAAFIEDPAFCLGYLPDNDGDRGNLVYIDEATGTAHPLKAQEVFALAVISELAFAAITNQGKEVVMAVVVNGPTSLRINEIAETFGVEVHRCEVGEANSIELARNLRNKGYLVRILGEGSNGGNITHPAAVRDPLNTLLSFIKLISLREDRDHTGMFKFWCGRSGRTEAYQEYFSIADAVGTLPAFSTTETGEPEAIMKIQSVSHASLKRTYEQLFESQWEKDRHGFFAELGIISWREFNTEGTAELEGSGPEFRSGKETGGLKIVFYDQTEHPTDFIWMRGSGTEPIFRILCDAKGGDKSREQRLLSWHRNLIDQADLISAGS